MNENQSRKPSRDIIRSLAIILVVGVHAVNRFYTFTIKGLSAVSRPSFVFCCLWRALGSEGVAFFFLLTGYLLLSRRYETYEDVINFWKKKFLPLLICYELWIVILEPLQIYKYGFSASALLKRIFMLEENELIRPMWYMHAIIGIYLFLPFLSMILHRITPKLMILPLSVCFVGLFIIPTFNLYMTVTGREPLSVKPDIYFVGGYKGMYVIFGFLIKEYIEPALQNASKKAGKCLLLGITALASLAVHVAVIALCFKYGYVYKMQYDIVFIAMFTIPVFLIILVIGNAFPFKRLWKEISVMSFGIFFIHYPLLLIALSLWKEQLASLPKPVAVPLFFFALFGISYAIAKLMAVLTPRLAQVLFLKKPEKKMP